MSVAGETNICSSVLQSVHQSINHTIEASKNTKKKKILAPIGPWPQHNGDSKRFDIIALNSISSPFSPEMKTKLPAPAAAAAAASQLPPCVARTLSLVGQAEPSRCALVEAKSSTIASDCFKCGYLTEAQAELPL